MSEHNDGKLSQRLHACVQDIWPRYLTHPFVTQMADGTLPAEKFRYYMLQDYLYLKDYVKIFAAILQKADDFEQIRFLSEELASTIDETFRTHLPYMQRPASRTMRSAARARTSTTVPTATICSARHSPGTC